MVGVADHDLDATMAECGLDETDRVRCHPFVAFGLPLLCFIFYIFMDFFVLGHHGYAAH